MKLTAEEKARASPVKEEPTLSIAARLDAPPTHKLPPGVQWDFDAENWSDPYQVSYYAMDTFNYLKGREHLFPIGDYMERQVCLSPWMRSLLVDWMVEVQESFELNHETLYLAVKLVDLYLTKVTVGKETLQLLGAASLFIASKFDVSIIVRRMRQPLCPIPLIHLCIYRKGSLRWSMTFYTSVTAPTRDEN